jgi:hypothetical protein
VFVVAPPTAVTAVVSRLSTSHVNVVVVDPDVRDRWLPPAVYANVDPDAPVTACGWAASA